MPKLDDGYLIVGFIHGSLDVSDENGCVVVSSTMTLKYAFRGELRGNTLKLTKTRWIGDPIREDHEPASRLDGSPTDAEFLHAHAQDSGGRDQWNLRPHEPKVDIAHRTGDELRAAGNAHGA